MDKKFFSFKNILPVCLILIICAVTFSLIVYYEQKEKVELFNNEGVEYVKAKVLETENENVQLNDTGYYTGAQDVTVKLLEGSHKDEILVVSNMMSYTYSVFCKPGMTVICNINSFEDIVMGHVYNVYRAPVLYALAAVFCLILCVIGGKKGVKSAVGLIFTFICIIFMFLPMVYHGFSPFFAAVIVASFTTVITLYMIGGWSLKTLFAILGTISGVLVSGTAAVIFGKLARLDGFAMPESENLMVVFRHTQLGIGELLFSGILIMSLGAVMDAAMSVASVVMEIYETNPGIKTKNLFISGVNVGRDIMGTMSNTIILVFAGSSLNSLLVIYSNEYQYNRLMNSNYIGAEILQGLTSSLGVIMTVPIVSYISAALIPKLYRKKI